MDVLVSGSFPHHVLRKERPVRLFRIRIMDEHGRAGFLAGRAGVFALGALPVLTESVDPQILTRFRAEEVAAAVPMLLAKTPTIVQITIEELG
jgi:hypothetical protein